MIRVYPRYWRISTNNTPPAITATSRNTAPAGNQHTGLDKAPGRERAGVGEVENDVTAVAVTAALSGGREAKVAEVGAGDEAAPGVGAGVSAPPA